MKAALPLVALLAQGCALQTWAVMQPRFQTREVHAAYQRAYDAVAVHCDGVSVHNPEAHVVLGKWQAWTAADGVTLTQCMVSVFPEDDYQGEVRITFAVRHCPLSDLADLEALAPTCERGDHVRQLVHTSLEALAQRLEADIKR